MKNDVYALLYAKGTETGKTYTESEDRKKRSLKKLLLGAGVPLLLLVVYQYIPAKLSRKITAEDRAAIGLEAGEKKLEIFYANAGLYEKSAGPEALETAFLPERPAKARTKEEAEITALVKNGADVLAYHAMGRILNGKVVPYNKYNFTAFSPTVRAATRNPAEFRKDLKLSMEKGKGTIIALIGSGREHFNILPDGSTDPGCSAGILTRFGKDHPEYLSRLKVIFFHPYSQDSLFGQPEYEDEKYERILKAGWINAFLGINLGSEDLAKPLVTEEGWKDRGFWAEGPGITNFTAKQISLDKKLTDSRLKGPGKGGDRADLYWLPWGARPKSREAARELAGAYALIFAGYSGEKPDFKAQRIIPAKVMGSR